jgi:hypothetical protein
VLGCTQNTVNIFTRLNLHLCQNQLVSIQFFSASSLFITIWCTFSNFLLLDFNIFSKTAQKDEYHVVGLQSHYKTAQYCSFVALTFITDVGFYIVCRIFCPNNKLNFCVSKTVGWIAWWSSIKSANPEIVGSSTSQFKNGEKNECIYQAFRNQNVLNLITIPSGI